MHRLATILKNSLHTVVLLVAAVGVGLYVAVRFNVAGAATERLLVDELAEQLGTRVEVRDVEVTWLNQIALEHFVLYDRQDDTLLYARRIMVAYNVWPLVAQRRLIINTIQLIDFDLRTGRPAQDAEPNYKFVLDALAPLQANQERSVIYDIDLNAIFLRKGRLRYAVGERTHLALSDISASLGIHVRHDDGVYFRLRRLAFAERDGLRLHEAQATVHITATHTDVDDLHLRLGDSELRAAGISVSNHPDALMRRHRAMQGRDSVRFLAETRDVRLRLVPADLSRIVSGVGHIDVPVVMSGDLHATTHEVSIPDLDIHFENELQVRAQFAATDLHRPLDSVLIDASIHDSFLTPHAASLLLEALWQWHSPEVRQVVDSLGTVRFAGRAYGIGANLALEGNVTTAAGGIAVAGSARSVFATGDLRTDGRLETEGLDLGRLTGRDMGLGEVAARFDIRAHKPAGGTMRAHVEGQASRLAYRQHTYRNIRLNGTADWHSYSGTLAIDDPLGRLAASGTLSTHAPRSFHFEATLDSVQPYALHLTDDARMDRLAVGARIRSDLEFRHWDEPNGRLTASDIVLRRPDDSLHLRNVTVETQSEDGRYEAYLKSPVLNVSYESNRPMSHLPADARVLLGRYLTAAAPAAARGTAARKGAKRAAPDSTASYTLVGSVPANAALSRMLRLPGLVARDASFTCHMDMADRRLYGEVRVPDVEYDGVQLAGAQLSFANSDTLLDFSAEGLLYDQGDGRTLRLGGKGSLGHDTLDASLDVDYTFNGNRLTTLLAGRAGLAPLSVTLHPTTLRLNDKLFDVGRTTMQQTGTHSFRLAGLSLQNGEQRLSASGDFGQQRGDSMAIDLHDFELDFLFDLLGKGYLSFGGQGTGRILYATAPTARFYTRHMQVEGFSYQDTLIGDADLDLSFDLDRRRIELASGIVTDGRYHSRIDGSVTLGEQNRIDILFRPDHMPVGFLNYWLGGFLQGFTARASGDVRLYGHGERLGVMGSPRLHDASFTHELLGARFTVNDTLRMELDTVGGQGRIRLVEADMTDRQGNHAVLSADVRHQDLGNFAYDVEVRLPQAPRQGFLVFDYPVQPQGATYWGELYANGAVSFRGAGNRHRIEADASLAAGSTFSLSPGEQSYTDNSYTFLTFRDKQSLLESAIARPPVLRARTNNIDRSDGEGHTVEATLQLAVNERCNVAVQMDPLAEDRLTCRGTGNLVLHYDSRRDLTVAGEYAMRNGTYTVTMRGDLMTKEFQLQNGSTVTFTGDPSQAELNLDAVYAIPSVNLRDLDENIAVQTNMNRTTVPVDCKLKVTGSLAAPQIDFDLEVRGVSDDVQALVHNIIGTPEMRNREVFYLLLFNKFYTPDYASTAQSNSGSELSSFASATLTSQLNSLLGHVSDNLTVGTNLRTDRGDFSDVEADVTVSTALLGDRLILNGSFGYRDPNSRVGVNNQSTSFVGDFDVEFLINPSGTLRAKAYSHHNERDYSINNALTTQGVGFVVRRDFASFTDLLRWRLVRKRLRDEEAEASPESH